MTLGQVWELIVLTAACALIVVGFPLALGILMWGAK